MSRLDEVENQIYGVEHFNVKFTDAKTGADKRGDQENIPDYPYCRALGGEKTVEEWKSIRILGNYPSFISVKVLDGYGSPADGKCYLSTVRSTYPKKTTIGNVTGNVSTPEIENINTEEPNKDYYEALKEGKFTPGVSSSSYTLRI